MKGGTQERERWETNKNQTDGLTLHPLLAFAFLPVLFLKLGYQSLVHVPGHVRQRTLLVLLCTTETRGGESVVRDWMQ